VLLTLLRYCAATGVKDDYEAKTMQCGEQLHDARLRRKALVVLLSHWQTVVCANKDVALLDPALAEQFKVNRFECTDDLEKPTPVDVRITIDSDSASEVEVDKEEVGRVFSTSKM
jgi:hypothetical protein